MQPDDELCLCFHVSQRKILNYLRIERPQHVAQLADCYGAGTGCGWCRPYLEKLFRAANEGADPKVELPLADDYAQGRATYVRSGGGTPPPGATPIPSHGSNQPTPTERKAVDEPTSERKSGDP